MRRAVPLLVALCVSCSSSIVVTRDERCDAIATSARSGAVSVVGSISGVVIDHRGRPVAGREVRLFADGVDSDIALQRRTGPAGEFDFGCVGATTYVVDVSRIPVHVRVEGGRRVVLRIRVW